MEKQKITIKLTKYQIFYLKSLVEQEYYNYNFLSSDELIDLDFVKYKLKTLEELIKIMGE